MPIFEFTCENCGWEFEELLRSTDTSEVSCPACDSQQIYKKISNIASQVSINPSIAPSIRSYPSCNTGST